MARKLVLSPQWPQKLQLRAVGSALSTELYIAFSALLEDAKAIVGLTAEDEAVAYLMSNVASETGTIVIEGLMPSVVIAGAGIDPTGAVDSTVAIQARIDAAAGGQAYLPPGRYRCDEPLTIPSDTALVGSGSTSVLRFTWTAAADGSYYIGNDDMADGNTGWSIRDLQIEGAGDGSPFGSATSPASGILARRGSDIAITGCRLYRVPGISIAYQGVQRIRITNNEIRQGGRDGITGWWYTDNLADVVVANNVIHTVGDDGIAINSSTGGNPNTTVRPCRIAITGNTIYGQPSYDADGAGRGVLVIGAEAVTISGNTISDTFSDGIAIYKDSLGSNFRPRNVAVTGNTIRRAGQAGDTTQPRKGIRLSGVDYATVTGNTVSEAAEDGIHVTDLTYSIVSNNNAHHNGTSCTALVAHFGINMSGDSTTLDVIGCVVEGNTLTLNAAGGVRNYYTNRCRVDGNVCADNGEAGDGTLAVSAGIYMRGSGRFFVGHNNCYETRTATARRQANGIRLESGVNPALLVVEGNYCDGHPGPNISISATPALYLKRGNYESGTPASNFDVEIGGIQRRAGAATPEAAIAAPVGSTFSRSDGGSGTSLYVKETGSGNTGWAAK